MRAQRKIGGLLAAVAFGMVLWGCPKDETPDKGGGTAPPTGTGSTTGGAPSGKKLQIAVIPKGTENSFWLGVKAGADGAAAEDPNIEIIWIGPAKENDPTEQIDVVQTEVTKKVDGIVLAAIDAEALAAPVKAATDKGVKVVTVDSGIAKDKDTSLAYIATDNVKGGQAAADTLAKAIGEKGDVGLLYFKKGSISSDQREKGFEDEIKKYPNIHLVQSREAGDTTKAVDETANMLTAHKDIVGIFAANEPNGIGVANVLKQRKLAGQIKVVAFDASDEEQKALQDGTILALIVQSPYQMGYLGVKTVVKAIKGEPITEKMVDSGLTVVTKDNFNTPDVQKLLNPTKK